MYGMTAAHPTLPLPSYARVTNVATGKSVIVRVNDRGPFLHDRIIDLSYAAANRIGIAAKGSGEVLVEAIIPGEGGMVVATAPSPPLGPPPRRAAWKRLPPAPISAESAGGFRRAIGGVPELQQRAEFPGPRAGAAGQRRSSRGCARSMASIGSIGSYPDREEAKRVGDRLTNAFGVATAIAPH